MGRGRLRIYLGAAPGVGKTYAMLNEGTRRSERGTDVVVGVVETHGRVHTAEQVGDLEVIPRHHLTYRGQQFEEMDTAAILERRPDVVLVDELAHTNAPGSTRAKRIEDVDVLLAAGIDVITTLNLQHLESVNDVVQTITGVLQRETVPDAMVRTADQIELVDMTPEALRRRLAHGNVYPADRIDAALSNFFRPGNLAALRELALLWLADRVDDELADYRERHGIEWAWETKERVIVSMSGAASSERLIRRAARIAARARGELIGITVRRDDGIRSADEEELAAKVSLLEELGGRYVEVVGADVASALVAAARTENATQLVIGATRRSWRAELLGGSIVQRCVRATAGEIDVHVIGVDPDEGEPEAPVRRRRPTSPLPRRRVLVALLLGLLAFPLVTVLLVTGGHTTQLPVALSAYLLVVIAVSALGGLIPGVVAALAAFLLSNYEFTDPVHTFTISSARDLLAVISFLVAAVTVSSLVDFAARRSAESVRAQRDARALSRIARLVVAGDAGVAQMVDELVRIFDLTGAELWTLDDGVDVLTARVGELRGATTEVRLDDAHVLRISGRRLDTERTDLLQAVSVQLVSALDRRRLELESAERLSLRKADELRSALLAAVSHDLRTPLSSIKAAATTLLSSSATFTASQHDELLTAIDHEADRLNALVEDLLDMGRIQEGSVETTTRPVDVVEAADAGVADALAASGDPHRRVVRTGRDALVLRTDPVLIRRVVFNLVLNALLHGGDGPVTVDIDAAGTAGVVRVVDHGDGIPPALRLLVLRPFQRLGDVAGIAGVGLGLAIAKGFVDALHGDLAIDDTPGGGCTIVVTLPLDAQYDPVGEESTA